MLICIFIILASIGIYFLASPYNLIDFSDFKGSVFGYESDVATGKYIAFYTVQFLQTTPILFQIEKIFPYALGWPIFILGTLGLLIILYNMLKNKLPATYYILLATFFLYLIPNSFLFAKWTRFMTPILPFFSIFAAYFLYKIFSFLKNLILKYQISKIKDQNLAKNLKLSTLNLALIFALCALSLLPGAAFMSIYFHKDTRVQASRWIYKNIPNNSYILSETGNVVDIPLALETGDATGGPPTSAHLSGGQGALVGGKERQDPSAKNYHVISTKILFFSINC